MCLRAGQDNVFHGQYCGSSRGCAAHAPSGVLFLGGLPRLPVPLGAVCACRACSCCPNVHMVQQQQGKAAGHVSRGARGTQSPLLRC
jgi:hypothetical protein